VHRYSVCGRMQSEQANAPQRPKSQLSQQMPSHWPDRPASPAGQVASLISDTIFGDVSTECPLNRRLQHRCTTCMTACLQGTKCGQANESRIAVCSHGPAQLRVTHSNRSCSRCRRRRGCVRCIRPRSAWVCSTCCCPRSTRDLRTRALGMWLRMHRNFVLCNLE